MSHHDATALAEVFPQSARRIMDLSARDAHLNELCRDVLVLLREKAKALSAPGGADTAYLADLEEALSELTDDIETLLRRIGVAEQELPEKRT